MAGHRFLLASFLHDFAGAEFLDGFSCPRIAETDGDQYAGFCATSSQESHEDLIDNPVVNAFANASGTYQFDLYSQTYTNALMNPSEQSNAAMCIVKTRYSGHVAAYSSEAKNPVWSAYRLDPAQQICLGYDRDSWRSDPILKGCNIAQSTTSTPGDVWGDQCGSEVYALSDIVCHADGTCSSDYSVFKSAVMDTHNENVCSWVNGDGDVKYSDITNGPIPDDAVAFHVYDEAISWDRGHTTPSHALTWSAASVRATFYMSNVAPQANVFNQVGWRLLESYLTDYSVAYDTLLLVVVGTAYNLDSIQVNSFENTWIPDYYWCAVCAPDKRQGWGLMVENVFENYPSGYWEDDGQTLATLTLDDFDVRLREHKVLLGDGKIMPNVCYEQGKLPVDSTFPSIDPTRTDIVHANPQSVRDASKCDASLCPDVASDTLVCPDSGGGDDQEDANSTPVESGCREWVDLSDVSATEATLMFSRYYEGSGYDKCVELTRYGPATDVDITHVEIRLYNNGNQWDTNQNTDSPSSTLTLTDILTTAGVLEDSLVICHRRMLDPVPDATMYLDSSTKVLYVSSSVVNFNGDDQLQLVNTSADASVKYLDVLGLGDGSQTTIGSVGTALKDHCVRRRNNTNPCKSTDFTDCAADWEVVHSLSEDSDRMCDLFKAKCPNDSELGVGETEEGAAMCEGAGCISSNEPNAIGYLRQFFTGTGADGGNEDSGAVGRSLFTIFGVASLAISSFW